MNTERLNVLLSEGRMKRNGAASGGNSLNGLNDLVNKYLGPDSVVVEIGSYEGASTELFALKCKSVTSVDPYDLGDNIAQEGLENLCGAELTFIDRMRNYDNCTKIKKTSEDALSSFEDGSLDAIYDDGDHDSIARDLNSWLPKLKKGGVMCGHDYYGHIKKAIDEIIPGVEVFSDSSWAKRID